MLEADLRGIRDCPLKPPLLAALRQAQMSGRCSLQCSLRHSRAGPEPHNCEAANGNRYPWWRVHREPAIWSARSWQRWALASRLAAISFSAPSAAFALRLGPFRLGLPFFGHPLAHRHQARPHSDDHTGVAYNATENPGAAGKEPAQAATGPAAALLSPSLALPTIYDAVFWPATSWPVGYDEILQAAFGKAAGDGDRHLCQADRASTVVKRIAAAIGPYEAQRPVLVGNSVPGERART
jgi:hypothetical protein